MTKDPYTWMSSMCRHSYAANWPHSKKHCPNLVANDEDDYFDNGSPVAVNIRYKKENVTHHSSLVDVWNSYYLTYLKADFPRLIVRFEDVLLRPVEVIGKVCECAGGELLKGDFKYVSDSAKGTTGAHKDASGLTEAIIRYTNSSKRIDDFQEEDLSYAIKNLDAGLIDTFHYFVKNN
uniref:Sulfotransferase n=3 Tax=Corethron hystrix TaxID=216773 RepID=A0A7S1FNH5_9STRA|mmetsp:Transcript_16182/g.36402  ORF Transcript_16182/g.36402 Transcript_16182/m.36402 type:complete len:178 (+) Transcript_16182:470-1003(+)|eukprot:CAMPEP_0113299560 /NCGR_PEP_ID=MMETSP0010_2-20120614/1547_1 /TAXON_ID=216773 ORGANISM="Corethron hystrix, Strain 308" /NCGR_SAMPLE_ID=MMETSP0010_2 /ASSEMBLY_ACC=CAM_ASM_000155 /LENGTH=177 /DNA_ID=CAMNT_0000152821 /DNA_START=364 /DNA_END=897 /DNA_ORIENTATION=+ /assembly_acc=CAM_ASM_000155